VSSKYVTTDAYQKYRTYFCFFFQQAGDEDLDESIKELVEITLKKMDKDHDNRLGDNDFSQSVREDPLLLSCFGQVFANSKVSIQYNQNH